MLVDSNLHRAYLPSEKAFAYKMKLEAMKHQGWRSDLTSDQVGGKLKTADPGAETGDSKIKSALYPPTHLIPEILQYVDEGRILLPPLSFPISTSKSNMTFWNRWS